MSLLACRTWVYYFFFTIIFFKTTNFVQPLIVWFVINKPSSFSLYTIPSLINSIQYKK